VTREVLLVKDGPDVLVRDAVDGSGSHELVWRFHLDPAVVADVDHHDVRLVVGEREAWLQVVDAAAGATTAIEDGWMSPSYGVRMKTRVVVITARTGLPVQATYRIGPTRLTTSSLQSLASALPMRRQEAAVGRRP
jgi:Heparinase II/III-like protein